MDEESKRKMASSNRQAMEMRAKKMMDRTKMEYEKIKPMPDIERYKKKPLRKDKMEYATVVPKNPNKGRM